MEPPVRKSGAVVKATALPFAESRMLALPSSVSPALAAAMIGGGAIGWSNALVIVGFGIFVIVGAVFLAIDAWRASPMLRLSFFGIVPLPRRVWSACDQSRLPRSHFRAQLIFPANQEIRAASNRSRIYADDCDCHRSKYPRRPSFGLDRGQAANGCVR